MKIRSTQDMGALIRDSRRHQNLDQQALADRIGVSRPWISELENGKATIRLDLVLRAIAALDLVIDIADRPIDGGKSRSAALIAKALDR
ncbi:helix-turn-helix domain-containing protein [uncultured Sphingomonas sp.]|uniref:helix-turn-helix domain-containing protein n=1 Tax=uncultured Sphingomonas sp. TaxID=158754 RepID=UPI0035CC841B